MTSPPALVLRGLTRIYGDGETAVTSLADLDLELARGSLTAVMGPSGSGKTTLLNLIAGLDAPTRGAIVLAGEDVSGWAAPRRARLRRQRIGVIFQGFELLPYLTAAQNVGLPHRLAGSRPDARRVAELLAAVGLADRADAFPAELSGGQQQRVAIARALLAGPELVLADEPTGALDSSAGRAVLSLLRTAVGEHGATVLMATHDPAAAALSDRVVFLLDGRIVGRQERPTAPVIAEWLAELDRRVERVAS